MPVNRRLVIDTAIRDFYSLFIHSILNLKRSFKDNRRYY